MIRRRSASSRSTDGASPCRVASTWPRRRDVRLQAGRPLRPQPSPGHRPRPRILDLSGRWSSLRDAGIVVDREGHAYVTGLSSFGFPTTPGAFDTSSSGGDAFVAKLDRNGTRLVYATFLGGSGFDEGIALALDDQGEVVVTGDTQSLDFPTTPGAFDTTYNGDSDVFVAKLDRTGSALVYSTLLGGTAGELGVAVALDQLRRAYVTGATQSTGFPSTPGAPRPHVQRWLRRRLHRQDRPDRIDTPLCHLARRIRGGRRDVVSRSTRRARSSWPDRPDRPTSRRHRERSTGPSVGWSTPSS